MNGLFGFRIRTSHYLTVAGEPVEVLAPDWRERAERNATAASLGRAIFECALLSIRLTQERPTGYPQ